jgi:predicted ATPase
MGKTRLAVETARALEGHFADGAHFIPLAPPNSADEMMLTAARGINLRLRSGSAPHQQLFHYLYNKQILLVLDNCEHLLNPAEAIADGWTNLLAQLLEEAPAVKILATSRVSLNLSAEWVRLLEGVSFPTSLEQGNLERYDAIKLFLDRVRRVRRDFNLVDHQGCVLEICRLVYGMPLALELAATWLKALSCQEVAAEIRESIDFLATGHRDIDERHRSIRAVFDYSWRLLTEEEQRVMRRLAVFRGGFGRAAAEQVAGASLQSLSSLIDKSFLYQNSTGLYEIHDLLRRYAEEQLDLDAVAGHLSSRSSILLAWLSLVRGNFEKAEKVAGEALKELSTAIGPDEEAFGLALFGLLAGLDQDYDRGRQLGEASLSLTQKLATTRFPITSILAHLGLAITHAGLDDYQAARRAVHSALSLSLKLNSPAFITLCLPVAAVVLAHEVELERAVELIALSFTHPASTPTWMERWALLTALRADLETELGPHIYRELWERGQKLNLETEVTDLLARFAD